MNVFHKSFKSEKQLYLKKAYNNSFIYVALFCYFSKHSKRSILSGDISSSTTNDILQYWKLTCYVTIM